MKTIREKITVKRRGLTLRGVIVMLFLVVLAAAALTPLVRGIRMKDRDKKTVAEYVLSLYVDPDLSEAERNQLELDNAEKIKEQKDKTGKFLTYVHSDVDNTIDHFLWKTTGLDAATIDDATEFIDKEHPEPEYGVSASADANKLAKRSEAMKSDMDLLAGLIEFKDAKIEKAQQPELLPAGPGAEEGPEVKFATLETTDAEAIEASETEPETLRVYMKRRVWEGFGISKGFAVGLYTGFMAERTMIKVIVIAAVLIIIFGWRRGRRTKKAFAKISYKIGKLPKAGTAGRQVQPSSDRNPFEEIPILAEIKEQLKQIPKQGKQLQTVVTQVESVSKEIFGCVEACANCKSNHRPVESCSNPKRTKSLRDLFLETQQQNRQLMSNASTRSSSRDSQVIGAMNAEATEKGLRSMISAMLSPDEVNARIVTAAMKGNLQALEGLKKLGHLTESNVNDPVTDDGKTALHIATRHAQFGVMEWLINLGAFNDVADNKGKTACDMLLQCLAEACVNDNTNIPNGFWNLRWSSSSSEDYDVWDDCDIEVPDPEDGNMIPFKCLAGRCGATNILTWIKDDAGDDINATDSDGRTTTELLMAYFAGQLSEGADEASEVMDGIRECLNEDIIDNDDINIVFRPIAHDTDNEPDEATILITATRLGLPDAVSELIEMGADRDVEVVVGNESKTALKILLECAGNVSTSKDTKSATLTKAYTEIRSILEVEQTDDDTTADKEE